jgi:hypothetical protein
VLAGTPIEGTLLSAGCWNSTRLGGTIGGRREREALGSTGLVAAGVAAGVVVFTGPGKAAAGGSMASVVTGCGIAGAGTVTGATASAGVAGVTSETCAACGRWATLITTAPPMAPARTSSTMFTGLMRNPSIATDEARASSVSTR